MISVFVKQRDGVIIAESHDEDEVFLSFNHIYDEGDYIEIVAKEHKHLIVKLDNSLIESEVYLPESRMIWTVPYGEHRLAYAPYAFEGNIHAATVRVADKKYLKTRRNIALNAMDLRGDVNFFPHCTANVETRGESCFAARNIIDGFRFCSFHGEWPYQSWGIGAREDAWCTIDFGREVEIDEIILTLRADFPHDAYWVSGHCVFSNGDQVSFPLCKTGRRQHIPLKKRIVSWIRFERMQKSNDPSAFPALVECEVLGMDIST